MYEKEANIENQLPATRIYLLLLILSIITVSIFTGLTQQVHSIAVEMPSEDQFNALYSRYPDTLSCPCNTTAISYRAFSRISVITYPLCSSEEFFYSVWSFPLDTNKTWIDNFDTFLLITQLRFFSLLCEIAKNEITLLPLNYISQQSITFETIPRQTFESETNSFSKSPIDEIANRFRHTFLIMLDTFHSNQLQNLYMTNWQTQFTDATENYILRTVPVSYNNGTCICAAGMFNCSRPLVFKDFNDQVFTLPGEKINKEIRVSEFNIDLLGIVTGCLPIDGLRLSTLECFFNQTCLNQLNTVLNSFIPMLSANSTQFSPSTTTIGSLIDGAFIESWLTSSNYSTYFLLCAPPICRYSYSERNNIVYILTTLLGLYGGLTVALRFLVWYNLRLVSWLLSCYHRRMGRVSSQNTVTTT